jgi:hypothetical protein
MGRKVVEATNACRILRTRGDITRRRRRAAAWAPGFFFVAGFFVADFVLVPEVFDEVAVVGG